MKIKKRIYDLVDNSLRSKLPLGEVLSGPFQGMKYAPSRSYCSSMWPKLVGCYETELHETFGELADQPYGEIWDIGCAEGYYAVGLARMFPDTRVLAFDISDDARKLCGELVQSNGLAEQVSIRSNCSRGTFNELNARCRNLIICDCEGFEDDLFDDKVVSQLKCADVIIELHERSRAGLTERLKGRFTKNHKVQIIRTRSELSEIFTTKHPIISKLNFIERRYAIAERRYGKMAWLVASSDMI